MLSILNLKIPFNFFFKLIFFFQLVLQSQQNLKVQIPHIPPTETQAKPPPRSTFATNNIIVNQSP